MNWTIEKTSVECYKIRPEKGFAWADITIDANGNKGRISISSDYGSYANYWNACGMPFKDFLSKIGIDYAADKFGADRWFDNEGTIRHYKQSIIEYRRDGNIDSKLARTIYNQIKSLDDYIHETEFVGVISTYEELMSFWNYCPNLCRSITPQFKSFWKELWPVLIEEFRKEKELIEIK